MAARHKIKIKSPPLHRFFEETASTSVLIHVVDNKIKQSKTTVYACVINKITLKTVNEL